MKRAHRWMGWGCLVFGALCFATPANAQSLWKKKSTAWSAVKQKGAAVSQQMVLSSPSRYEQLCAVFDTYQNKRKEQGIAMKDSCDAAVARSAVIATDFLNFGGPAFQANSMQLLQRIADSSLSGKELEKGIKIRNALFDAVYGTNSEILQWTAWLVQQEPHVISAAFNMAEIDISPQDIVLSGRVPNLWKRQLFAVAQDLRTMPMEVPGAGTQARAPSATPVGGKKPKEGTTGAGTTAGCFKSKYDGEGSFPTTPGGPAPSDPSPMGQSDSRAHHGLGDSGNTAGSGGTVSLATEVPAYMNAACANYGLYRQGGLVGGPYPLDAGLVKTSPTYWDQFSAIDQKPSATGFGKTGDPKKNGAAVSVEIYGAKDSKGKKTNAVQMHFEGTDGKTGKKYSGTVGTTSSQTPKNGQTIKVKTPTGTVTVKLKTEPAKEEKPPAEKPAPQPPAPQQPAPQQPGSHFNPEAVGDVGLCHTVVAALLGCLENHPSAGGEQICQTKPTNPDGPCEAPPSYSGKWDCFTTECTDATALEEACKKKFGPVADVGGAAGMPGEGGTMATLCAKGTKGSAPLIKEGYIIDWGPEGEPGGPGIKEDPCSTNPLTGKPKDAKQCCQEHPEKCAQPGPEPGGGGLMPGGI